MSWHAEKCCQGNALPPVLSLGPYPEEVRVVLTELSPSVQSKTVTDRHEVLDRVPNVVITRIRPVPLSGVLRNRQLVA